MTFPYEISTEPFFGLYIYNLYISQYIKKCVSAFLNAADTKKIIENRGELLD